MGKTDRQDRARQTAWEGQRDKLGEIRQMSKDTDREKETGRGVGQTDGKGQTQVDMEEEVRGRARRTKGRQTDKGTVRGKQTERAMDRVGESQVQEGDPGEAGR